MSKLETNTIDTVSGTSTLQVGSTNTTTITLGASGDTINIPSGATLNMSNGTMTLNSSMKNTPAFSASQGSFQSIANNTTTKLTSISTEDFDTDSDFASDKFTPTTAGKYFFILNLTYATDSDGQYAGVRLYKNGSQVESAFIVVQDYNRAILTTVQEANGSGDYFEAYADHQIGSSVNVKLAEFTAFKLIGV
jgi:hypothetical protein|tara:strand:+ start:28 stop:606 length:579 start_codon:yes stop_codon:yes gene_type:complete